MPLSQKSLKVEGKVTGLSQFYSDGTERLEIWISKKYKEVLPAKDNQRVPIKLVFGDQVYDAGLRMTPRCSVIWICPNLEMGGSKVRLADLVESSGFRKNDTLEIFVSEDNFVIPSPTLKNEG